jgi:hypothetical protein
VALSTLAHGVTAWPLSLAYGRGRSAASEAEMREVAPMPGHRA